MKHFTYLILVFAFTSFVFSQPEAMQTVRQVSNVATLRQTSVSGLASGQPIITAGYYVGNDSGGSSYNWDSESTAADNGGSVIQPTGVRTGRWILRPTSTINIKQFGAKGDGVTDDTTALQSAINLASVSSSTVLIPPVTAGNSYAFTQLTISGNLTLVGTGWQIPQTVCSYGGNWSSATGSVLKSNMVTTGDAIVIGSGDKNAVVNLRDFLLIGPGSGNSGGIGVGSAGATGIISSVWRKVLVGNFNTAYHLGWMEQSVWVGCGARGCSNGAIVGTADFNANTIVGFEGESCLVSAWNYAAAGGGNIHIGGVWQSNAQYSFIMGGNGNHIIGGWFENTSAAADDVVFISGAAGCSVSKTNNMKRPIRVKSGAQLTTISENTGNSVPIVTPNLIIESGSGPVFYANNANFTVSDATTNGNGNHLIGVQDGSAAPNGEIGEYIEAALSSGSPLSLTTATPANLISIVIPPGDWLVTACAVFSQDSGTTSTVCETGINTVSITLPSFDSGVVAGTSGIPRSSGYGGRTASGDPFTLRIDGLRIRVSKKTTYFLVAYSEFSGGTMAVSGLVNARRFR